MPPNICPHCGYVADDMPDEMAHMADEHLDIVVQRLRQANLHHEADELERGERGT